VDVSKSLALLAVAGGMIELVKALLPDSLSRNPRVLTGLCILAGFAATFLVRYSVWSKEQVIGDTTLDKLSTGSLIVVAIAVAGAEATAYLVLKRTGQAVANIGTPVPTVTQQAALDAAADRLTRSQLGPSAGGSHPVDPATFTFESADDPAAQ
jgi:hypothetical protein